MHKRSKKTKVFIFKVFRVSSEPNLIIELDFYCFEIILFAEKQSFEKIREMKLVYNR